MAYDSKTREIVAAKITSLYHRGYTSAYLIYTKLPEELGGRIVSKQTIRKMMFEEGLTNTAEAIQPVAVSLTREHNGKIEELDFVSIYEAADYVAKDLGLSRTYTRKLIEYSVREIDKRLNAGTYKGEMINLFNRDNITYESAGRTDPERLKAELERRRRTGILRLKK